MAGSGRQIPYGMRKRYEESNEVNKKRARTEGKRQITDILKHQQIEEIHKTGHRKDK
jgi:hypothetical protein